MERSKKRRKSLGTKANKSVTFYKLTDTVPSLECWDCGQPAEYMLKGNGFFCKKCLKQNRP